MSETIRAATLADAEAVAALHAASWRSAYRGILSDETLGAGLDEECRRHWCDKLATARADDLVLIVDGLAFIAVWAEAIGGSAPMSTISMSAPTGAVAASAGGCWARRLIARGERQVYLWAFDANVRAIDLYRRLGGEIVDGGFDTIDGRAVPHSRIVWRDVGRLVSSR